MPFPIATERVVEPRSSLHEPFLQRAASASGDQSASAHALGAFLTLRLVDQFAGDFEAAHPDALAYQTQATRDFLAELHPTTVETNYLLEIVRVAEGIRSSGAVRLLWPPLLALAHWLEQELRLDEALDVLESAIALSDGRQSEEEVSTYLQQGRVLRLMGRFGDSTSAYALGGQVATQLGDRHSALLSRIGRAIVLQKTGNLPESERVLRDVLAEARRLGDRDAEARACHDLSNTMYARGRNEEAAVLAFRAFELYEHPIQQTKALSDAGLVLKELGLYAAAKQALGAALSASPPPETRYRAMVELLELSALVSDRLSFERIRRDLEFSYERLPFDEQVEFRLKLGVGLSVFDRTSEAVAQLECALALAEQHRLAERLFKIEAVLQEVQEGASVGMPVPAGVPDKPTPDPELQKTLLSIAALEAGV